MPIDPPMSEIVLSTLNARYIHCAFGLRYLHANLGDLQSRAEIREFTINQRPVDVAEALLALNPKIIGLGVYIWNAEPTLALVQAIKQLRPDITVVLGGPEVSYETEGQALTQWADFVITGEGEVTFADLCRRLLKGGRPLLKVLPGEAPDLKTLKTPYHYYTDHDIKHRVLYVEASRGCPYRCEFCLSALDKTTRAFPLEAFLADMQTLFDRGARQFKFVDRTFNLNLSISQAIMEFFLERYEEGLFLHFEMIPDRLPEQLRGLIARFPAGALQFEIGIQSFNPEVAQRISRKQDLQRLNDNFHFLDRETGVHTHADLIIGLPGETLESFGEGLDRLIELRPNEVQIGILKRLRGAPINRHTERWQMVYNHAPPYEILQTEAIPFEQMQPLKRFARYWDLIANSGNFQSTLPFLWHEASPFQSFLHFSDWLYETTQAVHKISLERLVQLTLDYLTTVKQATRSHVGEHLLRDYTRSGRKPPKCLYEFTDSFQAPRPQTTSTLPKRQRRHQAGGAPALS